MTRRRKGRIGACAAGLLALVSALGAASEGPAWRVEDPRVRVAVPLRPGGAFEASTASLDGTLAFVASTPPTLMGELRVELATIDTGIALRNRHLVENYLEVPRGQGFDTAVLSGIVLDDASGPGFRGRTRFRAKLLLHGITADVSGEAAIREARPGLRVEASFPVGLPEFGIDPPNYMGVGVANKVLVKVAFTAVATPDVDR